MGRARNSKRANSGKPSTPPRNRQIFLPLLRPPRRSPDDKIGHVKFLSPVPSFVALGLFLAPALTTLAEDPARAPISRIITQMQRKDYEGDRAALKRSYDDLSVFLKNKNVASRVRYWRGFAMWRRAINGFNDSVDSKELETDLNQALEEFKQSLDADPQFVESKIATISCLGNLIFIHQNEEAKVRELIEQSSPLVKEVQGSAPENPRFLWVLGPILFTTSPAQGGGQDKAIALYNRGLESVKNSTAATTDPLDPSWGEPELLMSLAWSNLNKSAPDLDAAEQNARAALHLVPYWHYVKNILLPQITAAIVKSKTQ
jgi:tetratricopeptide (TPR) repeat protein